ncbi:hypothetical protein [Methanolobus chelungpuianus]|uniref:hypothetical protein n=1 Tax=Methanolobus chelungpuianus TaxID=502115 RepID=UPI0021157A41|nr:hypothetical protein [Methanolobus chelungpuianus]
MMCRFYHECDYASSVAFTCREGGGNYCGKYRLLVMGSTGSGTVLQEYELASGEKEILI